MIYLYSGTPGSGKSLHMANDLYWWIRKGRGVVLNFDIATNKIPQRKHAPVLYLDNSRLKPELLIEYSREYFRRHKFKEGAIRIYIDECQLLFNAREWQKEGRSEWLSFFTQHRKYGYDVFLVAQFDKMIDKQIRSLIEYEYIHRKVKNFGAWGTFFNLMAGGGLFVCVEMWYPLHEKVGREFFHARKKYYSLYDTLNTFDGGETSGKKEDSRQGYFPIRDYIG